MPSFWPVAYTAAYSGVNLPPKCDSSSAQCPGPGGAQVMSVTQQLHRPLGRTADDGPVTPDDDGSLDQDRVLHHGVEQFGGLCVGQAFLLVYRLAGAHHRPRVVDAEQ